VKSDVQNARGVPAAPAFVRQIADLVRQNNTTRLESGHRLAREPGSDSRPSGKGERSRACTRVGRASPETSALSEAHESSERRAVTSYDEWRVSIPQ